uniref:Glycosyltransferase family 28 N-terminal domain-containing protein n=1 Tax=Odontella aurita TaxID=265563 RepID=A0A7S4MBL6_9STRA|mmetsp:Transcript_16591/g.47766  ORF Transcript_16591/g.47766 Transcript_16591/m.47766 type:complete len:733 (+) Transcript_16591:152-2350(+)
MGLKLHIRSGYNLSLRSYAGVTSKFVKPTFEVSVALTDGRGIPLSDVEASGCVASIRHMSGGTSHGNSWTATKSVKGSPNQQDLERGVCHWDEVVEVDTGKHGSSGEPITPDTCVEIAVRRDFGHLHPSHEIGRTRMTVRELSEMDDDGGGLHLMLFDLAWFDNDGNVVAAGKDHLPTFVLVSVVRKSLPPELREIEAKPSDTDETRRSKYAKRLMVVTRGTRGDIQPFIALSRGLAEMENWEIIIVTETEYLSELRTQKNVKAGAIRFRPSGGNTMKKVHSEVSQKAINLKISAKQTNVMQKIFLARSEIEFFPSEPAVFHWAKVMKPDLLMFGFTMASVTLIASEALGIPVAGFVLQPTSIPSSQYPPVLPLTEERFNLLTAETKEEKHDQFKKIKYAMENVGGKTNKSSLESLRERRGLELYSSYKKSTWQELKDKNFPLIVPINETLFGGKPKDWSENSVFTDCIFLRGATVPSLASDVMNFIDKCRAMDGKIVILAFSSMPVSKSKIISIALKIIGECQSKACVFALVGGQVDLPLHSSMEAEANEALESNRLFIASGAPFGRLFPLVDAVVLHGGLGTTSEAIQAGVPAIVTGVLLLDQRFWGSRCHQLEVGPFGTHIDDFPDNCVDVVDKALEEDSVWRKNAKRRGFVMTKQAGDDLSGVRKNVECVVRMSKTAKPYYYSRADDNEELDSSTSHHGIGSLGESLSHFNDDDEDGFGRDEVHFQLM